jgi:hypothetical protein
MLDAYSAVPPQGGTFILLAFIFAKKGGYGIFDAYAQSVIFS